jgi:hypothetical protein
MITSAAKEWKITGLSSRAHIKHRFIRRATNPGIPRRFNSRTTSSPNDVKP